MRERSARGSYAGAALAAALLLCALAGGCGNGHGEEGCPELCEQVGACDDAAQTEEQCLTQCNAEQETAEEKGCADLYGDYLECAGHADSVCDADALENECKLQLTGYENCKG